LPWIEYGKGEWIYLNHGTLKELGLPAAKVEQALTAWLRQQPGIQAAYGRSQLEQGPIKDDPIGEMMRLSFYAEHSGDVAVVLKPHYMVSGPITDKKYDAFRTTHGTPYPYDTHVPLIVFGPGVRPGVREERVTTMSAAAILARAPGVPPPEGADN